jgi:hypothetical protein
MLEDALEPVFERFNVQLALWGHVHDYERTCAVRRRKCVRPRQNGTTHVIIGNAGHGVHDVPGRAYQCGLWIYPEPEWIAFRTMEHGYSRLTANSTSLHFEAVMNRDRQVHDAFWLHA